MPSTSEPTQPMYVNTRPVIPPPGTPGTDSGPRQPPAPPPSAVVEPPELLHDQAKIKFWRDRAIQAEARLAERDRQAQQQSQEILDLSWKAKVAADWTQWCEHHSLEFTPLKGTPAVVLHPHGEDEQVEDCSVTSKRKLSRRSKSSRSTCWTPSKATLNLRVRRPWFPSTVSTVTIWSRTSHGHPGLISLSLWRWQAASDAR